MLTMTIKYYSILFIYSICLLYLFYSIYVCCLIARTQKEWNLLIKFKDCFFCLFFNTRSDFEKMLNPHESNLVLVLYPQNILFIIIFFVENRF